ncbi:hypothetical protein BZA77DRAFT_292169 [Pyronema omphalodes]|nr:hypothetical protein BZA77DRAFT_362516 [Pyronema omphalodes]KAI5817636.1 hypothetical protein BZA77DRAFT_292169 [Pyronema omphalodes]
MQFSIILPVVIASLSAVAIAAPAPAPEPAAAAAAGNSCHWHVFNAATKATENKTGTYACCTENGKEANGKPKLSCKSSNAMCAGGFSKTWCCPSGDVSSGNGCQKNFLQK